MVCALFPPRGRYLRVFALILTTCAFLNFSMLRRSPSGILSQPTMSHSPTLLVRLDSPRVYLSTNPWKVTSTLRTVSSTREEYVDLIENLKASAPLKPKLKVEFAHQSLIVVLEGRLEVIDKEITVRVLARCCGLPLLSVTLSHRLYSLLLIFSVYNGPAKRLSNAIFSLLKLKSGKLERDGRLTSLTMSTTIWKAVTYVFFCLDWDNVESFHHRMRKMANTNIKRIIFLRKRTRTS